MQYAVVFFAFSSPCGACLPEKKKQVFEQGFVRFQLGFGSWFLDQGPQ